MNKKYLIILLVFFGILFFVSGSNQVFAGETHNYGCSYDGCPGQWTHWWCDDSGWCSVGDCLGNPVSYCSWGGCSASCGGGIQYNTCYLQCGGSYGNGSQACNTQACCTGVYGSCTGWGTCSATCGGGTQSRTCYDTGCGTAQNQSQACNTQACYIDIGLRTYSGTAVINIACEPLGTLTSPLRIAKAGNIYGIALVATTDTNASKIRIQTSSGIKAIRKL